MLERLIFWVSNIYFNKIEEATLLLKSSPAISTSLNWFISSSSVQLKLRTFFLVINALFMLWISFNSSSSKLTSTITSLGEKSCSYCGSGVVDIVNKVWIINDLVQY